MFDSPLPPRGGLLSKLLVLIGTSRLEEIIHLT
jgi:hypothetical protein